MPVSNENQSQPREVAKNASAPEAGGTESPATANEPTRVAVIMAHPDDAEFGCAGTIAKWAREGQVITYVLLTSGDKGSEDAALTAEQLMATREAEQRAACDILGVRDVIFLRKPDAMLVPDLALRCEIVRVIRQVQPDVVICQDPTIHWHGQSYLNHPDHRAAATASLEAIYPAARDRRTFPELLAEGLEPHKVREVYLANAKEPDTWIDITETMPTKFAALRAHVSQIGDWEFEAMLTEWAREEATRGGTDAEYVEAFKYFKLD